MRKIIICVIIGMILSGCASQETRAQRRFQKCQVMVHNLVIDNPGVAEYVEKNHPCVQYALQPESSGPSVFARILGGVALIKGAQGPNVNCSTHQLGNTTYTNCH